ncbi:AraC family transcriptional regulator [Paenibacillus sp. GYB003]|uniref:AraC family transcriptional regulator n=1 Tax=Paenibacillus sp. GYB003 TaxID=2994392 RepID=UPI002F963790
MKQDVKSYLFKVAVVLIVVSGIPVLLATVYNMNLLMKQTVSLIDAKNENELTRTGNLIERTFRQIMDFANSVVADSRFGSARTPTEQWKTFNELNKLVSANPYIAEYALYNGSDRSLIVSGYGIQRRPEESSMPWIAADMPQLLPYEVVLKEGVSRTGVPYASIVQKLPAADGAQNLFIFNVDLDKIYGSFLSELNIDADIYNYYLTDAAGKIVYHRDARRIGLPSAGPEAGPEAGPDRPRIATNRHKLSAFNWYLIGEVNTERLYGDVARLKTKVVAVLFVVLGFVVLLIVAGLRELYKPFKRVVSKAAESEELLRRTMLHRMITGPSVIREEWGPHLGDMPPFHVVAFLSSKMPDRDSFSGREMDLLRDKLGKAFRVEWFPEAGGDRLALFQLDTDDMNRFLTELVPCLEEDPTGSIAIGVGGIHAWADVHLSYIEAMYAYHIGRMYTADSNLYCYSKLPMDYGSAMKAPAIEELELTVRQQNERGYTDALNALFSDQLTVVEYNLNFYLVVSMLLRLFGQHSLPLLNELNGLITDKGIMNVTAVKQFLLTKFYEYREYADDPKNYARQIAEYIADHYAENFSLDDMAGHLGITKQHLIGVCKKSYNRTPIDYLNEYRIETAKRLLADADTKISEIGLKTGFNSNSYFTKVFKQHTGITPSEYRELLTGRSRGAPGGTEPAEA